MVSHPRANGVLCQWKWRFCKTTFLISENSVMSVIVWTAETEDLGNSWCHYLNLMVDTHVHSVFLWCLTWRTDYKLLAPTDLACIQFLYCLWTERYSLTPLGWMFFGFWFFLQPQRKKFIFKNICLSVDVAWLCGLDGLNFSKHKHKYKAWHETLFGKLIFSWPILLWGEKLVHCWCLKCLQILSLWFYRNCWQHAPIREYRVYGQNNAQFTPDLFSSLHVAWAQARKTNLDVNCFADLVLTVQFQAETLLIISLQKP